MRYLAEAVALLRSSGLSITAASGVYETEPVECAPQPPYLNQVLLGAAPVLASLFLATCQRVERKLGRTGRGHHSARTLDVDLLFSGGLVVVTPRLILPHPAIPRRRSILVPLAEVAPQWRHPLLGKSVLELLAECREPSWVKPLSRTGS